MGGKALTKVSSLTTSIDNKHYPEHCHSSLRMLQESLINEQQSSLGLDSFISLEDLWNLKVNINEPGVAWE